MQQNQDYKQLLTEVIKKQIVILGPDITLQKARNVQGLVVADDGTVTDISGAPQEITQKLIDQFVQLSGEIVKKTMEPLLNMNHPQATSTGSEQPAPTPLTPAQTTQTQAIPATPPPAAPQETKEPVAQPAPSAPLPTTTDSIPGVTPPPPINFPTATPTTTDTAQADAPLAQAPKPVQ